MRPEQSLSPVLRHGCLVSTLATCVLSNGPASEQWRIFGLSTPLMLVRSKLSGMRQHSNCRRFCRSWGMSENFLSELMLGDVAHIIDPHPSHRAPPEVREGVPFAGIGDISEAGELLPGKGRVVSKGV